MAGKTKMSKWSEKTKSASSGAMPARAEENALAKPISIVVVGMSQAGKSTLLKLIYEVLGLKPPATLETGNGNVACTMDPFVYELVYPTQEYDPFLKQDHPEFELPEKGISHEEFMTQFLTRTDYKANHRKREHGQQYRINIIDTPGYDDSTAGKDEDHACKILQKLQSCQHVNAFLFVLGKGTHYGGGFQKVFNQYWNTFAQFRDRFMIVQTKWDPAETLEKDKEARVYEFQRIFASEQASKLKHIFIESRWKGGGRLPDPREQHKLALAIQSLNEIFDLAATYPKQRTADLEYYKTQVMRDMDNKLEGYLEGMYKGAKDALKDVQAKEQEMYKEVAQIAKNLAKAQADKEKLEKRLKAIDTDDTMSNGTVSVTHAGHYFSSTKTTKTIESKTEDGKKPCPIYQHKTTVNADYKYAEWVDVNVDQNVLTGTLRSSWWAGHNGTLTAYVRTKDYFEGEVFLKKSEAMCLQREIDESRRREMELNAAIKGLDNVQKLKKRADLIGACISELKSHSIPLITFLKFRDYYAFKSTESHAMFREWARAKGGLDDLLEIML